MTKKVRIENADTSAYKVTVELWDKKYDGSPDILYKKLVLGSPAMLLEEYIHSGRYLIVKEE